MKKTLSENTAFLNLAIETYLYQYENNPIYKLLCNYLYPKKVIPTKLTDIPFMPIELFRKNLIKTNSFLPESIFLSSGTSSEEKSKHAIKSIKNYHTNVLAIFSEFYGNPSDYNIISLLPGYAQNENSSLISMVNYLSNLSKSKKTHYDSFKNLAEYLIAKEEKKEKTILFGVTHALLKFAKEYKLKLKNTIIIETGGMKGKGEEFTREQVHKILKSAFNLKLIHSEYGMTELLSQAYSKDNGIFKMNKTLKVLIRDINDPLTYSPVNKSGGINIIDLANINTCSFIATEDIGVCLNETEFKVLGRLDNSMLRGCNQLSYTD